MSGRFEYAKRLRVDHVNPILGVVDESAFLKLAAASFGEPDECWLWAGKKSRGYGAWVFGGKMYLVHRVMYAIHYRKELLMCGCHTCDNPACFNPSHIFDGSIRDNMRDMYAKGRGRVVRARGEASGNAKLTEALVIKIYQDPRPAAAVAREIGISEGQARAVRSGAAWRHVYARFHNIDGEVNHA